MGRISSLHKKPARPKSAYAIFVQKYYATIQDSTKSFAERSRACSEAWSSLSEEGKKIYQEMATLDKSRYNTEIKKYEALPNKLKMKPRHKKKKDRTMPKKPLTPYLCFAKEMRPLIKEKRPELSFGEIGKTLGKMWAELDDKSKEKYARLSQIDHDRYLVEMSKYAEKKQQANEECSLKA